MNQYQSDSIDQLFTALAKAQGKISGAAKDCANPYFKSKYADLNSVWNACREALSENGLAVIQAVRQGDSGEISLHTTLGHSSGQWMASSMPIRIKGDGKTNELQMLGSSLSYLRRYSLAALVGVAPADEDDDGNNAGGYRAPQAKQSVVQPMSTATITGSQVQDMRHLLSQCGGEYVSTIMEWLKSLRIMTLEAMPATYYDKVKTRIEHHLQSDEPEKLAGVQ